MRQKDWRSLSHEQGVMLVLIGFDYDPAVQQQSMGCMMITIASAIRWAMME
jgi:hypothetical protein